MGSPVAPVYDADQNLLLNLRWTAVFFCFWCVYVPCMSNYFNSYHLGQELCVSVNLMIRKQSLSVWKLKDCTYIGVLVNNYLHVDMCYWSSCMLESLQRNTPYRQHLQLSGDQAVGFFLWECRLKMNPASEQKLCQKEGGLQCMKLVLIHSWAQMLLWEMYSL